MFGVDWNDPQTMWLNVANLALGLATLACVGLLAYSVGAELLAGLKRRFAVQDSHTFEVAELGLTMADGGEALPEEKPKKPRSKKS